MCRNSTIAGFIPFLVFTQNILHYLIGREKLFKNFSKDNQKGSYYTVDGIITEQSKILDEIIEGTFKYSK